MRERAHIDEKPRRLRRMYGDIEIEEEEYRQKKQELQSRLSTLVLPNTPQLVSAGEYLVNLKPLWEAATLQEKRDITRIFLDAIYMNLSTRQIVAIKPKVSFRFLLVDVCKRLGVEVK